MSPLSAADREALIAGTAVTAFVERGTLTEGDEIELQTDEDVIGIVVFVDPAAAAAGATGPEAGRGDLAVIRAYRRGHPIVGDEDFTVMRLAAEGALRE